MVLASQENRTSRTGALIGADQRVSVEDALKALTIWADYQDFDEKVKGSIEPGKLADFVILSDNPLKIVSAKLFNLQVLETIKEGNTIYKKQ